MQMTYMLGRHVTMYSEASGDQARAGQGITRYCAMSPPVTRCNYCSSGTTMNIVTDRYRLNKHQYYLYCPHIFYIIFIKYYLNS